LQPKGTYAQLPGHTRNPDRIIGVLLHEPARLPD